MRGDVEILLASGEPAPRRRATVALCRCGASGIKPYCDGSHKAVGFRTDDEPTEAGRTRPHRAAPDGIRRAGQSARTTETSSTRTVTGTFVVVLERSAASPV